jgi:DNA-binding FadR family transcriptional regulator
VAPLANTWRLSSVERASMTEQVLRELREAIIEGRIPQGEPLREVSLASTLGTGRSAVREAIRQLVQEGLVDYEPPRPGASSARRRSISPTCAPRSTRSRRPPPPTPTSSPSR